MTAVARGELARLFRWPVKSMAGEEVGAAEVSPDGVLGDRAHALVDGRDPRGRPLSARRVPAVLAWAAAYPEAAEEGPATPVVTAPDGRHLRFDDPVLPGLLSSSLGRPMTLRTEARGQQDRRATVHASFEATRRAVEEELGRPLALERFRPNLHLELDAPPFAEHGWEGRRIEVGGAVLRVREPCDRCGVPTRDPHRPGERWPELLRWLFEAHGGAFGTILVVERPGRVARGDRVRVV